MEGMVKILRNILRKHGKSTDRKSITVIRGVEVLGKVTMYETGWWRPNKSTSIRKTIMKYWGKKMQLSLRKMMEVLGLNQIHFLLRSPQDNP